MDLDFPVPDEHRLLFEQMRRDKSIVDWEPEGEWDMERSPGPGRSMGVFVPTVEDDGSRSYRVWMKAEEEQ